MTPKEAKQFRIALENIESIYYYGGWDETRDDMFTWIRKDEVLSLIQKFVEHPKFQYPNLGYAESKRPR